MKDKRMLATVRDFVVVVITACLAILAAATVCYVSGFVPLYVGMLTIFAYLTFLSVYLTVRLRHGRSATYTPDSATKGGDLTAFLLSSPHPALLCDKRDRVLWYNEAFLLALERTDVPKDTPMQELCFPMAAEDLPISVEGEDVRSLGTGLYSCDKLYMSANGGCYLYTFHAITEWAQTGLLLSESRTECENDQTAVAYIIIDNVEDLLQNIQEQFREATARVSDILRDWIADMKGVIRSYERDKYIAVFSYKGLKQCIDSRFDILDRIRSVHIGDQLPVTVSIGVSCIRNGSLSEREALAQDALDMALQRGGDQVVYKNDRGTDFFGGKTKAIYKRANVRARTVGMQLIRLMEDADNILIMGHQNGDYDSFGATVGMARFALQHRDRKNVHIVVERSDKNLRSCFERVAMLPDYKDMFCSPNEAPAYVTPGTLLIIVDVNHFPHTECPKLIDMVEQIAIIDHHTQSAAFERKIALSYIEPSASSASELVAEILEQHLGAIRLEKEEAELMLSGILLDTKQLVRSTGTRTFGAARFLRGEGADPSETNELFKNDVGDMRKQAQFLANVMIYREHIAIAVCEGNTDSTYRIIAAKAADRLLTGRGISASFALVTIGAKVHISARSDGTVNVAKILEELHGGGHFDAAGAQVDANEESIERLKRAIDKHYNKT